MKTKTVHDNDFLNAALRGYQAQLEDIHGKMEGIRQKLRGKAPDADGVKRTHRISTEGRARIAAAQRLRWSKAKRATA